MSFSARWKTEAERCVRRAGFTRLSSITRGSPRTRIALVDGPVESHASVDATHLSTVTQPYARGRNSAAAGHATFIASMLVSTDAECVGLCPGCHLVSIPVIDDDMLGDHVDPGQSSHRMATAIRTAIWERAHVIQLSLDLAFDYAREGQLIAASVEAAVNEGAAVVVAMGWPAARNPLLDIGGVIPVVGADRSGIPMIDARLPSSTRCITAPGTAIPGAVLPNGIRLRSGSSFACSFVTAAIALLLDAVPGATVHDAVRSLFTNPDDFCEISGACTWNNLDADESLVALTERMGTSNVQ